MDYATQPLGWKLKKASRYVRLYGLRRTWYKVRAHKHMAKRYVKLPRCDAGSDPGGHVGIVGCGKFAYSVIAYYLRRQFGRVIRGCMDVDLHRAASLYQAFGLRYYTDDASRLIHDPFIDIVFIASNHASHAEYAIRALRAGKAVHVEKPHCVDERQLRSLCEALQETGGRIALGFNRPVSRFGRMIQERLSAQSGPAMFNWFVAGHDIEPDHWYLRREEGGRIVGNVCHWTDFVYHMVPPERRFPITITPTPSEGVNVNIALTLAFGDGSVAAITFSEKGHAFEGVRERLSAHKGDLLLWLDDFRTLTLDLGAQRRRYQSRYRAQGHEERIAKSYRMAQGRERGAAVSYVWETGLLFLKAREAVETGRPVVVEGFEASF